MTLMEKMNLVLEANEKKDIQSLLSTKEIKDVIKKKDLLDAQFAKVFDYYLDNRIMPYDVAKAKRADPYEWIIDRLIKVFGKK